MSVIFYILLSVFVISFMSFIGILTLGLKVTKLKTILIYFLAFSAGALFGDAFIHLLPEITEEGFTLGVSLAVLSGIVLFFAIEKFIHWQHCHMPITKGHVHSFAYMNLVGDALHNTIDGMIIAASYFISIPVGVATSIAVILHEIPQEIGDFGVLLHGGFSRGKALFLNFISALTAVLGALVVIFLGGAIPGFMTAILGIAIGGFIYIAGADLIPELHKEVQLSRSILQFISFVLGIAVMFLLLFIE